MNRSLLLLVAPLLGLSGAHAAVSTTDETLRSASNIHLSSVWTSGESFRGRYRRDFRGNALELRLDQDDGGFDTGIGSPSEAPSVDSVHDRYYVRGRMRFVAASGGDGTGRWWYGPKISVDWTPSPSREGWFENYVIENAERSVSEVHEWLTSSGAYHFARTTHDGAVYRHYLRPWETWYQFFAVRQTYREGGSTSLKPILEAWRRYPSDAFPEYRPALSNGRITSIKIGVETTGENRGTFDFDDVYIPEDFTKPPAVPYGEPGEPRYVRIRRTAPDRYLQARDRTVASEVIGHGGRRDWRAQQWLLEKVDADVYRVRNRWSGLYLAADSPNETDVLRARELQEEYWAQRWSLERRGGCHRLRNRWSDLYLSIPEGGGNAAQQLQSVPDDGRQCLLLEPLD